MDQEHSLSIKVLVIFLCVFIILVGILPAIIYSSILPDSAQNIAWGHAWSWGYTQHPPLGVWFLNVMILIFKNIELATYLASAICLAVSLLIYIEYQKYF